MSLGACTARQFNRILCRLKLNFIRHHASARYHSSEASSHSQIAFNRTLSTVTRGSPILSENSLPQAKQFRFNSSEMQLSCPSDEGQQQRLSQFNQNLNAYLSIRGNLPSMKELNAEAYVSLAEGARVSQLQQIMNLLANDFIRHFPRNSDPEGFSKVAVSILSYASQYCALTPRRTIKLFNALVCLNPLQQITLPPKAWERVYCAAIKHPELCQFSLESMATLLLSQQPEQVHPRFIWLTYQIIIQILMRGEESYPQALTVFQQIVDLGHVPKLAQQLAQDEGGSFKTMMTSTLVRGCLEFNWYIKAAELIMELLQDSRWSQAQGTSTEDIQATTLLGLEVLHVLVRSPTRQEVNTCRVLIQALLSTSSPLRDAPHPVQIPHPDLLAFYEACYDYKLVGHAASVYVQLHASWVRQHHYYPPPRNAALFWLFDHFADPGVSEDGRSSHKGYIRMARSILSDIIYRGIPVPVVDRPRFIAIAAARGFGFYARQLWEMYTVENDLNRDAVRGNAQMLVPVVKLFRKLQEAWDKGVDRERTIAAKRDKDHINGPAKLDHSNQGVAIKCHNIHKATLHAKKSVLPDAWRFANHVLNSYIATKLPLAMASQEDLNALARAHLILDHVSEGVEALSIVMERGDIPDMKDVNVALGAIARYSPRHAARMLEQMIKRGVRPSASAFSAVLHAALKTEDFRLVDVLISRARKLGYGALTPRAVAALVQSITTFKYTEHEVERARQKSNLDAVIETVEAIIKAPSTQRRNKDHGKDHVLSVRMGQMCIDASLKAMEPELALRFWRLLVKDRVWWEDQGAQSTRASIGDCIKDRWKRSQLHEEEAREMLEGLGMAHVD